jgi:hypothetical protein
MTVRALEPRGRGRLGELLAELAEHEVLAAALDERERGGVPERGRTAVAHHDLVAVGNAEQLAEALTHPPDQALHRRLAVRGAEQRRPGRRERVHLLRPHLGGAATEAAVCGQEVRGDRDLRHATDSSCV